MKRGHPWRPLPRMWESGREYLYKAFGGVPAVAKSAELNPTQLYRTLSEKGNPELRSLSALLRTMGLRLAVQPLGKSVPHV